MKPHAPTSFLISLLLLSMIGCDNQSGHPLRIAHNNWPGYESLPLAESEQLYQGVNVITHRLDSATEVIRAFKQDVVDVAAVTLDEALLLQSKIEDEIQIIAVMDISHGADAILARKTIASMAELKGKKVGVESTALGAFFISRATDLTPGLSLKELKIIPVTYSHHHEAFLANEVDAIVTFEPVKSMILKSSAHVIFDSTSIPNEIVDILITRRQFAESNSKALKALVAGHFKALKYIEHNSKDALTKMAKFEKIGIDEFEKSLSGLKIPNKKENHILLDSQSPLLKKTIKKLHLFLVKNKIINNKMATINPADKYTAYAA